MGVVYNKWTHYWYIEPMKYQGAVPVRVMDISKAFGSENLHSHAYSLSYIIMIINECTHSVNFCLFQLFWPFWCSRFSIHPIMRSCTRPFPVDKSWWRPENHKMQTSYLSEINIYCIIIYCMSMLSLYIEPTDSMIVKIKSLKISTHNGKLISL